MLKSKKLISIFMTGIILLSSIPAIAQARPNTTKTVQNHRIQQVITKVTKTKYIKSKKAYLTYCQTEDEEIYTYYDTENQSNKWLVLIVDDKANNNIKDDVVIQSYNLDNYIFSK